MYVHTTTPVAVSWHDASPQAGWPGSPFEELLASLAHWPACESEGVKRGPVDKPAYCTHSDIEVHTFVCM